MREPGMQCRVRANRHRETGAASVLRFELPSECMDHQAGGQTTEAAFGRETNSDHEGKPMRRKPDIIEAIRNKKLFGSLPEFRDLSTWFAWIVWLKSLFAISLNESELALFQK